MPAGREHSEPRVRDLRLNREWALVSGLGLRVAEDLEGIGVRKVLDRLDREDIKKIIECVQGS